MPHQPKKINPKVGKNDLEVAHPGPDLSLMDEDGLISIDAISDAMMNKGRLPELLGVFEEETPKQDESGSGTGTDGNIVMPGSAAEEYLYEKIPKELSDAINLIETGDYNKASVYLIDLLDNTSTTPQIKLMARFIQYHNYFMLEKLGQLKMSHRKQIKDGYQEIKPYLDSRIFDDELTELLRKVLGDFARGK